MRKKNSATRKLVASIALLAISATSLFGSTYAWFTMNKEVSVTGMEMKAHSEEGLLINEVKAAASTTWDEAATANTSPITIALRPASTYDFTKWWHANSKKSADEAGIGELSDTVDVAGGKYTEVTAGATGIKDKVWVGAESAESGGAVGNTKAETHVYYADAHFGAHPAGEGDTYDDGEGYYIKYTYYLKSSSQDDMTVTNLQAQVKATNKAGADPTKLDPALRIGIAVPVSNANNAAIAGTKIFAPIPGSETLGATNTSYSVTMEATGAGTGANAPKTVNPVVASAVGSYTAYTQLNIDGETVTNVTIPKVTSDGIPVYVYVWFEGEDTHCMSDNLTATLSEYQIDINFKDADLG